MVEWHPKTLFYFNDTTKTEMIIQYTIASSYYYMKIVILYSYSGI